MATEQAIIKWFEELKRFLHRKYMLEICKDPNHFLKGDKTSVNMSHKTFKVIADKKYK